MTLAIVPAYTRSDADLEMLGHCLDTMRAHEPWLEALVVDDASPHPGTADAAASSGALCSVREENGGFSKAVNVGLRHAQQAGRDAVLVNSDILFDRPFVGPMRDDPADVVGALLYYRHGLVQHGGVYFSRLTRAWDHLFRYAPLDLEEVQARRVCPVTAALMYIRAPVLERVGLYDEGFPLAFEDVDFCLRAFEAGFECAYQPAANAMHLESVSRSDGHRHEDERASWARLVDKHDLAEFERWAYP